MGRTSRILFQNAANILTGSRIVCTFMFCYCVNNLFKQGMEIPIYFNCFIWLLIICLSDFFDGKIARKFQIANSFGATFDVIADLVFVFSIHIQLAYYHIIPAWYIALIIEKIANYIITSHNISRKSSGEFFYIRDSIGKIVSASYFITPFLIIFLCKFKSVDYILIPLCIAIQAMLGIYSSVYRWKKCVSI